MLYQILRPTVQLCLQFYCKRLAIVGKETLPHDKPILFCSTHSNSFLDALFLTVYMDYPVYPLARGDAFKKPIVAKALREFKMLPIFRQSEGEEGAAAKNEASFQACQTLFKANKKVLIYPEGICKHQRNVMPLKKGAALMARRAWEEGIDLQIVPVGIYYDDFFKWGKKCDVVFGAALTQKDFVAYNDTNFANHFNQVLLGKMQEVFPSPFMFQNNKLHNGIWSQVIYYIGWCINAPHYLFCQLLGTKLTKGTIFHDSAVLGLTAILLPFYYLTLLLVVWCFI